VRGRWGWVLLLSVWAMSSRVDAASAEDGGGRDVSVALFSTRTLHAVTLTPVGESSWTARCAQCAHELLKAPLHFVGPTEMFAGGSLRVSDDVSGDVRTAVGLWHLRASGKDHEIDVVLTLPSERYVAAVLNAEAAAGEPAESLRALAILARTYALNGAHYAAQPGHLAADLCDSTECQAMLPGPVSQEIDDATLATAGETLWFGGRRAEAFFSQSCGGVTEDGGVLWPRLRGAPYLRSHVDPYCVRRDRAPWHAEVPLTKFAELSRAEGWHVPGRILEARVSERSTSHRAVRVVFSGADGGTGIVSASALRFGIGRTLGWNLIRSDGYEVGVRNGALVFDGRGHGHGVGLCQEGAAEMAVEGKSAREILAFYFAGTTVGVLRGDGGWRESRLGTITVRATQALTTGREGMLERSWGEAQRRFPPRRAIAPEIIFAPTTEVFRQMTSQPGWELASTRGSTVVFQPETVLAARGGDVSVAVLHEMLHVLVEAEASERAPLWLREGLVESLADVPGKSRSVNFMSADAIEGALTHAGSLRASENAHLAAAVRVRALIGRYGLSTVRGWLSSGVPAGVE
jgi:stage II sporulation protein D